MTLSTPERFNDTSDDRRTTYTNEYTTDTKTRDHGADDGEDNGVDVKGLGL